LPFAIHIAFLPTDCSKPISLTVCIIVAVVGHNIIVPRTRNYCFCLSGYDLRLCGKVSHAFIPTHFNVLDDVDGETLLKIVGTSSSYLQPKNRQNASPRSLDYSVDPRM
jgi:hypothetical protein